MRASLLVPYLLVACLLGCAGQRLAIELPATEAWTLDEFQGARLVRECTLENGDPRRAALQQWLTRNSSGWTPSTRIFLPGTLVTGSNFSLNLNTLGAAAVLNYGHVQYTKDKLRGAAPELRCPVPAPAPATRR